MTDQQEQQRINEAAEQFTDALAHSYKTLAERGVEAVEQGAQVTEVLFNQTINNLHAQAEENRRATQQLAEQQQRQAEAVQSIAQESVGAYLDLVDSMFYWPGGIQAAEGVLGKPRRRPLRVTRVSRAKTTPINGSPGCKSPGSFHVL